MGCSLMEATQPTRPLWLLIDAPNHCHRDYHAAGEGAAELFARRVDALIDHARPVMIAAAFDSPRSFRREIEPTYKATRPPTPAGVADCMQSVREWCLANEIHIVEADGFEADDCLATLAMIGRRRDSRVVIASSDKDLRQLLDVGKIDQLVACRRSGGKLTCEWMTAKRVAEQYGVEPWQWVDFQTIVGDSSDNVIGAEGCGPVVAAKLLGKCHTLEGYYSNPWAAPLTPRQHALLAKFKERYKTVRRLVTLRRDTPIPGAWFEEAA